MRLSARTILNRVFYSFRKPGPALCAVVCVGLVYCSTLCILEKRDFWIVDNANKFLLLQAIINSDYSDFSIPWPGQSIDPTFEYNPLPNQFSKVYEGKLYSIFSPFFPTISSFTFRLFGFWGLYILPALAGLMTLLALSRITSMISSHRWAGVIAVLIAGLCTPLWFYSVVFWEHVVGACFVLWAILYFLYFLRSNKVSHLVRCCACAAISVYFRDELYLFCAVLLVMMLLHTRGRRFRTMLLAVCGIVVGLVPLWLFQLYTIGSPLGFHLQSALTTTAGLKEYISERPNVFYYLFAAFHPHGAFSIVLAFPFLAAFLLRPLLKRRIVTRVIPLLILYALISTLISLRGYIAGDNVIDWMFRTNSLFSTAPVLIFAFVPLRNSAQAVESHARERCIWQIALIYAILYGLCSHDVGAAGIHWGNRFLLMLYPMLAILAGVNIAEGIEWERLRFNWRVAVGAAAILISLSAQTYSIYLLKEKKALSHQLNIQIKEYDESVVITNVWWVPQLLHSEFYNKMYFVVGSKEQLSTLLETLHNNGYERCLFVTQSSSGSAVKDAITVYDRKMSFFSLTFVKATI